MLISDVNIIQIVLVRTREKKSTIGHFWRSSASRLRQWRSLKICLKLRTS